jgi:hypothetical protein
MDLVACFVAFWLASAVRSQTAPASPPIDLGLVRADDTLQPLARLEGEAWTTLPAADGGGAWRLWPFDDPIVRTSPFTARAARAITAARPVPARSGCVAASGIDAELRTPAAAASGIGVALRGTDARPDVPVIVAVDTELGKQLATRAAAAFHRAEDETLTLEAEELPAGFPRFAARREHPVEWTRIARHGVAQGSTRTYYLEGQKTYPGFRGRTDIGEIRTTGYVFIQVSGDRETVDAEVDLSDVAGHQSVFRAPIAIVSWPSRAVWLFATRGPDGRHLELMELTPGTNRPRSVWLGPDGCQ